MGKGRAAYGNPDTNRIQVLKGSKIIVQIRKILGDNGAIGKGAGNIVVRGEAVIGCLHVVRF
jgi:hypothetical protein